MWLRECSYWFTSLLVEEGIQCGGKAVKVVEGKPFCAKHPYKDRKEIGPDPEWVEEHFHRGVSKEWPSSEEGAER